MEKAVIFALDKGTSLGDLGKEATIWTCYVQYQVGEFRIIFMSNALSTLTRVTYPLLHFV